VSVAHGLSGSKKPAPQIKPKDFLPFPNWDEANSNSKETADEATRFVLSQLIQKRRIPVHVFVALMQSGT